MHNNYFFLKHLSRSLSARLTGRRLIECFSQNRDELVMSFLSEDKREFFLHANLGSEFSCLQFPVNYARARRNTATIWPEIHGAVVSGVEQIANERAFVLYFHNGYKVLFKLFGNRANLVLYQGKIFQSIFKNQLRPDQLLVPDQLVRELDLSWESFQEKQGNIRQFLPTLGKLGEKYLEEKEYNSLNLESQYELVRALLKEMAQPLFHLIKMEGLFYLSMFRIAEVTETFDDPIEAINRFYQLHFKFNHLEKELQQIRGLMEQRLNASLTYLQKLNQRFGEIQVSVPYGQMADILMANLHNVPKNAQKVTLFDFYRDKEITLKLKKDLSPQKNAEQLYRKEKNRHIEIDQLKSQISTKEEEVLKLQVDLEGLETVSDYRSLEKYRNEYKQKEKQEAAEDPNFKLFEFAGFKIYVGRNAANNDELTQKFAHKEDLWLHARDVAGSHVIVRHQAGKPFPKNVIEKAASIAAYYSKRKNESLCPVQYTLKKFVRKVKGSAKGEVKLDKETVVMVVPGEG